jgi:formylglycine-generating enzyme
MKTRLVLPVALLLLAIGPAPSRAVVMNFTSGTVTSYTYDGWGGPDAYFEWGVYQYIESGVTVDSLAGCFFLAGGGLNLAMESGPVSFSMGGRPFDLVSIDASWLGTGDPNVGPYTFTSSKGGCVDVTADGTYTFPNTRQWKDITSFQWTPHIFGLIDNVTINPVPEPSTLALLGISAAGLLGYAWRRRKKLRTVGLMILAATTALIAGSAQADVFHMGAGLTSLQTVPVGNAGNANDWTGWGGVAYDYRMSTYDVTNAQYAEFLNAKAKNSDPLALWNAKMGSDAQGGITRSGSGPYTYTVKSGHENQPVVDVTWFDALRFANWLNNGQGVGHTETGTYVLLGGTPTPSNASTISRTVGARWVLPSENEWYKAAYYDPALHSGSGGYWLYPTKSNARPTSQAPPGGPNSANFYDPTTGFALTHSTTSNPSYNYLTDVGAYGSSRSAYETIDQGGDVWQWNETDIFADGSSRCLRGGSFNSRSDYLLSSGRRDSINPPTLQDCGVGFRVAFVPEPGSLAMLLTGAIVLLACAWRRPAA